MFQVVAAALDKIRDEIATEDVDEALEQEESFLGIAFVVGQTYIYGTIGDANKIAKLSGKGKPTDLLKKFSATIAGTSITKIQLCDAIADYFKHEWPNWLTTNPRNGQSRQLLAVLGIDQGITHPCREAAKLLLGNPEYDFDQFLSALKDWRQKVIADSK